MEEQPEVSQRELRMRSEETMDAVRRRFITRGDFARGSQLAPRVDLAGLRADQDAAFGYVIHSKPSSD